MSETRKRKQARPQRNRKAAKRDALSSASTHNCIHCDRALDEELDCPFCILVDPPARLDPAYGDLFATELRLLACHNAKINPLWYCTHCGRRVKASVVKLDVSTTQTHVWCNMDHYQQTQRFVTETIYAIVVGSAPSPPPLPLVPPFQLVPGGPTVPPSLKSEEQSSACQTPASGHDP